MLPTPATSQQAKSPSNSIRSSNSASNSSSVLVASSDHTGLSGDGDHTVPRCLHLEQLLVNDTESEIIKKFKAVISWKITRAYEKTSQLKRRKLQMPTCGICSLTLHRPFVCLQCSFSGCWKDGHVIQHLEEKEHGFCVDSASGAIFCIACDDFIHHGKMNAIYTKIIIVAEENHTHFQVGKKPREHYKPWIPDQEALSLLEYADPVSCQGRRGLLNLGQTCYLNVVLQAFIHNPLLRNYFLSDSHNHKLCKIKDCVCCEMDKLFAEIYSANTAPYGPISLLASTWRVSSELSGYAQQDAHEFFISALNQIHTTSRGSTNVSCNCIIHSTFSGQLQSDVKCGRCDNITSTVDPLLDISIELKGKGIDGSQNSLAACLRRYTHPEKLGSNEYSCSKCGTDSHEATKRLSIRKLPPVLCFQLKRFEHNTTDKSAARKIDTPIRFPAVINMLEFTTVAAGMGELGGSGDGPKDLGPQTMYDYDLFAVINHEGQLNNGHYTNFARYCDEWYRFDDDKVYPSTLQNCLNSMAYMCFYVKRHLDYKPYQRPSYALKRETEAVREREREKELEKEKEAARMREVEDALLATV
ncbi:cysteine proteinase [Hysterangium stoloniferum]|nr:cysteine proteinase [Hysterangium stoloniferum]